jgi:hypothetical protein
MVLTRKGNGESQAGTRECARFTKLPLFYKRPGHGALVAYGNAAWVGVVAKSQIFEVAIHGDETGDERFDGEPGAVDLFAINISERVAGARSDDRAAFRPRGDLGHRHGCCRRFIGLGGGSVFSFLPHWMRPGGRPSAASTCDGTNLTHL